MTAAQVVKALSGRWYGSYGMVRCPVHDDNRPSLKISNRLDGDILVHCFSGCDWHNVRDALAQKGLLREYEAHRDSSFRTHRSLKNTAGESARQSKHKGSALKIWSQSHAARGTPVEKYLGSRGLSLLDSDQLRFHEGLKHPDGGIWPAMVALVTNRNNAPQAIHRTFLASDGDSKAPVAPPKMMLGPCRGGAVRLAPLEENLMVGEGIETCLAAMQATGKAAWAALSTSGLKTLELPQEVKGVTILADGDQAGEAAAILAAQRWTEGGRRVRIARPPAGTDFAETLLAKHGSDRSRSKKHHV